MTEPAVTAELTFTVAPTLEFPNPAPNPMKIAGAPTALGTPLAHFVLSVQSPVAVVCHVERVSVSSLTTRTLSMKYSLVGSSIGSPADGAPPFEVAKCNLQ